MNCAQKVAQDGVAPSKQNRLLSVIMKTGGSDCYPPDKRAPKAMCEKCVIIDGKIDHYRLIASRITDQALLDGVTELIKRLNAEKDALHPEERGDGQTGP
jgi:hypothetical protein